MLERIVIRNFKRFDEVEIELGEAVVFIGPNNSGKTSALQALALWELGLRRWLEKRGGKSAPKKRAGVAINRRDLVSLPVPDANLLWKDLRLRHVDKLDGKQQTQNIRVDIVVTGVSHGKTWDCGLEFDFANSESIYCRPMRIDPADPETRMEVPEEASSVRLAYLPPMSGLASNETLLNPGAVQVRLGEGRTAEVLRNLCYQLLHDNVETRAWDELKARVRELFGVDLERPIYVPERGEITMAYLDLGGARLDLSASGRGLQQTVLLLAYLLANPGAVLLLDEPDAHLEILRQRQIYGALIEVAEQRGCQVVAASHSEVLLNEAAGRNVVVAFVGKPHRIDDGVAQVRKSLQNIGFEHYYQAEHVGWVLYLEGSTDLRILQAFARTLNHPCAMYLERPFVHYIGNDLQAARTHFYGLREAKVDLAGVLLVDRTERQLNEGGALVEMQWRRNEIENYFCFPTILEAYAASQVTKQSVGPLFAAAEADRLRGIMRNSIEDQLPPAALRDPEHRFWQTTKASDDFLDPVFDAFFGQLSLPNLLRKSRYHELATLVPREQIDPEVVEKLDAIVEVQRQARPAHES